MAKPISAANASTRLLVAPITVFALVALGFVITTGLHNRGARDVAAPQDNLAQLIPGCVLVVALVLALFTSSRRRLGLTAFAVAVAIRFAGPLLVDAIPSVELREVVWLAKPPAGTDWVNAIAAGENTTLASAGVVLFGMTVLIVACVVWIGAALRPVLLAPALRASFGIDSTLLIGVLAVLGSVSWTSGYGYGLDPGDLLSSFSNGNVWAFTRTIVWLLPAILWLAFTCRRGGVLALGAAAGFFTAVAVIPWAMDMLAVRLDGPTSVLAFDAGARPDYVLSGYEAFDIAGTSALVIVPAGGLLLVSLWSALSHHATASRVSISAPAGAPANPLAVVAFVLAWIPLTCLPAIVLGHMAYDQVTTSTEPQRGVGLARWSIVLGYLTLIGTALVAQKTWIRG